MSGFVMCGCVYVWVCNVWVCVCVGFVTFWCFCNMCICIYRVLYCLYCFVLFRLCIFILICSVCTGVRTAAVSISDNANRSNNNNVPLNVINSVRMSLF
jgi:hypothetical protein